MKKRNAILGLMLGLTTAMVLTGCGGDPAPEPEPEPQPIPEPVVEEEKKIEVKHDPAPEGFDVSELSDLDDLLADVGL